MGIGRAITSPNSDLRDAKITVTPDGRLMLAGAEAINVPTTHRHQSLVWFSADGRTWSDKHKVGDRDNWLWRITWHKGKAYGFGYGCRNDNRGIRLFASSDGKSFETLIDKASVEGTYPNETSLVFLPTIRATACCGKTDSRTTDLGTSRPPYTEWNWQKLGVPIGGPHMIRLPDGRFVAAVRLYDQTVRTSLCWIDPAAGKLTEFLALLTAATGYAGLVLHDGLLSVSTTRRTRAGSSIYLAKVRIGPPRAVTDCAPPGVESGPPGSGGRKVRKNTAGARRTTL